MSSRAPVIDLTHDDDDQDTPTQLQTNPRGSANLLDLPRGFEHWGGDWLAEYLATPNEATRGRAKSPVNRQTRPQVQADHFRATGPSVDSDGSMSIRSLAGSRPICINCHEVGNVTCDGELPCSACAEPSLDCVYPDQLQRHKATKKSPMRESSNFRSGRSEKPDNTTLSRIETTTKTTFRLNRATSSLPPPAVLASRISQTASEKLNYPRDIATELVTPVVATDYSSDSDVHVSDLDLDNLDQVTKVLKRHEARMRAHREYLLQPLLSRAKRGSVRETGSELPRGMQNPFVNLIAAKASRKPEATSVSKLSLQIKSHKSGASKKWIPMTVPMLVVKTNSTLLPKYKSIGRLTTSFLAPNSEVMKYLPYFPDMENQPEKEQKRQEEIKRWYNDDIQKMRNQRTCAELVALWKPCVEQFVSQLEIQFKDILWCILDAPEEWQCSGCDTTIDTSRFSAILNSDVLTRPDSRSLRRAQSAMKALDARAGFSMWHIVVDTDLVVEAVKRAVSPDATEPSLCSICFLFDCMTHGAYIESEENHTGAAVFHGGDTDEGGISSVSINDDENIRNERIMVELPNDEHERIHKHLCGLFCVDGETPTKAILGRRHDGTIGGVYNRTSHATRPALKNDETCSDDCFWFIEKRLRYSRAYQTKSFEPNLSLDNKELFRHLFQLYSANQRAPCMISKDITGLSCLDAFYYILAETRRPSHVDQVQYDQQQLTTQKLSKLAQGYDMSMSAALDHRPPFIPCSHEGPCHNNPECACSEDKVHCEQSCGCDSTCKRRFRGCSCAGTNNKVCFSDSRCECWSLNRECDPWLCGTCGALEVLDPMNKYNEDVRKGRCKNTKIQLELPARTIKAPSEIQGWGLFAGQDLDAHAFVGEYKGEIVDNAESDRRGSVYHHLGQEYLFVVNRDQQIDGSNFGNKMRFINNSQRDSCINVLATKLLCNGVQRIMLYAKRPIKAGDELLYNYNYPDSVTKLFWERGGEPQDGPGAIIDKPSIPQLNGRIVKMAGKQDEAYQDKRSTSATGNRANGKTSQGPTAREKPSTNGHNSKRKRAERDSGRSVGLDMKHMNGEEENQHEIHESEYDDDRISEDETDSQLEVTGTSSSSDHEVTLTTIRRQRQVYPNDRRRGGQAQRQAWKTRKQNLARK